MSYQVTIGLTLGTSQAGLTLEAQPVSTTGASVGAAITTGFVEYGGGQYSWTGSLPDGHTGGVKFQLSGGGAFKAFAPINPQEVENPDTKTSTRSTYAGGAVASVTGNVGGNVVGSVGSVVADVGITQAGADKVWASAARTLTGFGTLVADIWANTSRTLSAFSFTVTVGTNQDKTGYSLSSAGVQAIWDALTSALTTVGSVGKLLVDNVNASISSRLAASAYTAPLDSPATASAVQTGLTAQGYTSARAPLLDNLNATISSRLATAGYTAPPAVAAIVAGVLDELLSNHTGVGSVGAGIAAAGAAGDPWSTALPGAYASGTAGYLLGHQTPAPTVAAIVDGVLDEPLAGHSTVGTVGAGISSAGASGDPMSVIVPGSYAAGTAGYRIGHLTDVQLQYVSPVLAGGTLKLVSGAAYQAERGNAITFPALTSSAPNLTGATVTLEIAYSTALVKSFSCTVSGPTAAQVITVDDITVAQNTLGAGDQYRYSVWARWADGDADAVPLLAGPCIVQARP